MLDDEQQPGLPAHGRRRRRDRARASTPAATVIFETTLPVGDTREPVRPAPGGRVGPRRRARLLRRVLARAAVHGRRVRATSRPTRSSSAASARRPRTGRRGSTPSVLDAEVVAMSTRGGGRAEQARRHDVPRPEHRLRQRAGPLRRPDRGGHPRGDPGGQQPAVQPHPPAGPRRGRPLHPGLPALPPVARAGDGARRGGRGGSTTARSDVAIRALRDGPRLAGGRARPRPRPDLPRGREGARLLAGAPADRASRLPGRPRLGVGPAAVGRRGRALRRRAVGLGNAERRPGDRRPDRRPGVPRASTRAGSRTSRSCSTAGTACAMLAFPERVLVLGIGVPPRGGSRPPAGESGAAPSAPGTAG